MKKKKDNGLRAVLCLAAATIVVGGASIALSRLEQAERGTVLDITGANTKIKEARQRPDGTYAVTISENGYIGEMVIEAVYSADGQTLLSYDVLSHTETENIGAKVDEDAYKAVLAGVKLPVTTAGLDISGILGLEAEKSSVADGLKDGPFTAKTEANEAGDYSYVTITVADGKVTNVVWDEITGGASKAELAANGQYVMVEGNPTWKDQSESLGAYVVANQTTDGIMNETGYTDAVSGVSIYVGGFVDLVNQAMAQASATVALKDGPHTAQTEPNEKGDYGYVTVTIENGKIVSAIWDEITGGASKAELAANGQYVMVEGNPTWKDQSESLGAYVVENQTTDGIMNETGYTDAVSGVSIYVGGFVDLANQAIAQASENGVVPGAAAAPAIDATSVDVVSGATFSSKAVVRAINEGFVYLRDFILNK